jgi:DNA-binding MarR family transcriptional regulator
MPLGWYAVLVTLASSPTGRVRMQELAGSVLLSVSGLTRLFDRMEQAGLVRRRPCVSDKRGTYALLTAAGRRAFRRAAPVHMWGIHDYFAAHITVAEAAAMESALRKVIEAVDPHAA